MAQDDTANIKKAVGVRSVFLAARRDKNLVGRFFHMEGQFLLERDGRQTTKRALADVMVYMAGTYGKALTLEEVELGLLAAAKDISVDNERVDEIPEPPASVEPTAFIDDEPEDDEVVEMESSDSDDGDWVTADYKEDAPPKHESKGRPGVKPDDDMREAMKYGDGRLTRDDVGISTLELALRYYDFIANDLAKPETEKQVKHKVKLSIGSTMKALGWKKRMKKGEWGWYPIELEEYFSGEPTAVSPAIDPDSVMLRKRHELVEDEEQPIEVSKTLQEVLPKLSEAKEEIDDDLPWPDMGEGFTDGLPERREEPVKFVNHKEGTEEVEIKELVFDKTMTFFEDEDGNKRMLEWDAEEEIWSFHIDREAV